MGMSETLFTITRHLSVDIIHKTIFSISSLRDEYDLPSALGIIHHIMIIKDHRKERNRLFAVSRCPLLFERALVYHSLTQPS